MSNSAPEIARLEGQLRLLSEVVGAFAEPTADLSRVLNDIVRRIAQHFGDGCSLILLSEDGTTLRSTVYHHASERGAEAPPFPAAVPLGAHPFAAKILASGEALLIPKVDLEALRGQLPPSIYERNKALGVHSALILPLRAGGRRVGLMFLTRDDPRRPSFGAQDRVFAQSLADHAALAILNAGAFAAERAAREGLAEAERVYFELSPIAMLVIDAETTHALEVNEAALLLYGYQRQEFMDMTLDRLRPDEDPTVPDRIRSIVEAGIDCRGLTRHRRKDGALIDLEYVVRPTVFAGRRALLQVVNDVTERIRGEQARARLASIVDSSQDAILSTDASGIISSWNKGAARIFGYPASEIVGRSILQLIPPERHDEEAHIIGRLERGESVQEFETVRVRSDGRHIDVSLTVSPVYDAQRRFAGISKVARDITDRKRLEEQRRRIGELDADNQRIAEASRLKSEFLANMSHELRTPLNAVIGFAAFMRDGEAGPISSEQEEYLGDILTSSRHLLHLINDVLDLAKIEAGRLALHAESVDVSAVVREVADTLGGMAAEKRLRVVTNVDGAIGTVTSDGRALRQVLYNYLSNAIKFTEPGGQIWLRAVAESQAFFRIEVADTGIGVDPADIPKLFVDFQQLDSGLAKQYQGTGLGLALTKGIVEALGGTVGVQSTPGQGSRFTARLPRRPPGT